MSTRSWRTTPLPPNWPAIRRAVLERDNYQCTWRLGNGRPCGAAATDVDHTGRPDDHSPAALRSLCGPHHKRRSSAQGGQGRAAAIARKPRRRPAEPHPGIAGPAGASRAARPPVPGSGG